MPPAYLIVQVTISNEEQYSQYRTAVVPLIAEFGGKHMVRGGTVELLEGPPDGGRPAIFEFPSLETIHTFWHSPEYTKVKELRRGAGTLRAWAAPG